MKTDKTDITLSLTAEEHAIFKIVANVSALSVESFLIKAARKKARSIIMNRVEQLAMEGDVEFKDPVST